MVKFEFDLLGNPGGSDNPTDLGHPNKPVSGRITFHRYPLHPNPALASAETWKINKPLSARLHCFTSAKQAPSPRKEL
jgi:hypothetical protein